MTWKKNLNCLKIKKKMSQNFNGNRNSNRNYKITWKKPPGFLMIGDTPFSSKWPLYQIGISLIHISHKICYVKLCCAWEKLQMSTCHEPLQLLTESTTGLVNPQCQRSSGYQNIHTRVCETREGLTMIIVPHVDLCWETNSVGHQHSFPRVLLICCWLLHAYI